jgi:hypothetical protein
MKGKTVWIAVSPYRGLTLLSEYLMGSDPIGVYLNARLEEFIRGLTLNLASLIRENQGNRRTFSATYTHSGSAPHSLHKYT